MDRHSYTALETCNNNCCNAWLGLNEAICCCQCWNNRWHFTVERRNFSWNWNCVHYGFDCQLLDMHWEFFYYVCDFNLSDISKPSGPTISSHCNSWSALTLYVTVLQHFTRKVLGFTYIDSFPLWLYSVDYIAHTCCYTSQGATRYYFTFFFH